MWRAGISVRNPFIAAMCAGPRRNLRRGPAKVNEEDRNFREGLIKSARAVCKRFSAIVRRDFAGIIVFISRNHNEAVAKKIRKAPQTHLISGSSRIHSEVRREKNRRRLEVVNTGSKGPVERSACRRLSGGLSAFLCKKTGRNPPPGLAKGAWICYTP